MYCLKCGNKIPEGSVYCQNCGVKYSYNETERPRIVKNTAKKVAKAFMILGTVSNAVTFLLLSLIWCVPMTSSYSEMIERGEKVGTGFKICTMLFVSFIAGLIMLFDKDSFEVKTKPETKQLRIDNDNK